jgi:hypothetical protein
MRDSHATERHEQRDQGDDHRRGEMLAHAVSPPRFRLFFDSPASGAAAGSYRENPGSGPVDERYACRLVAARDTCCPRGRTLRMIGIRPGTSPDDQAVLVVVQDEPFRF